MDFFSSNPENFGANCFRFGDSIDEFSVSMLLKWRILFKDGKELVLIFHFVNSFVVILRVSSRMLNKYSGDISFII